MVGDGPYRREPEARLEGPVLMAMLDHSAVSRPIAASQPGPAPLRRGRATGPR